ncbi:Crp/Fnr family transcriptional regulator [Flaviaesturariibacter amylovorans]|uniref:Crp/Fnr family transcriptional regulator n=1 Tax=Flaviaesturariibacter amylovorans TaxID=1084520 RepID=A0ABP8GCL1_9BACT
MYELLFRHLDKYVTLTEEERALCVPFFEHRKFRKRQFLLQEGEVSRYEYFILKGCARIYEVDENGQEHILQFGIEEWWVGDMHSFFTGTPSRYSIDCIEDCDVLRMTAENHERLCAAVPKLERHFRKLIQWAYVASVQRIQSAMSKSAGERYLEFITKYPQIEQRVPNHYIASYLGITPQSLSRVRSRRLSESKK